MWAVSLLVLAALAGHYLDKRFAEWNKRVEAVEEFATSETARADSLHSEATAHSERADSLFSTYAARQPEVRERILFVRDSVTGPDTCLSVVAQRDRIIDDLVAQNDVVVAAYEAEKSAAEQLRSAYSSLLVVNDSLRAVLGDRPLPPPSFLPRINVGPFVGVCSTGQPCVGFGIGITWKIPVKIF